MNSDSALLRKYLRYIVPAMAGQLIFTLYIIVDGIFVARGVSETALAAVSIVTPFVTLLFAISITFAVGTSTVVARLLGENRTIEAREVFTESVAAMFVLSIAGSVLIFVFINPLSGLLGASDATLPYVKQYLLTIVPFIFSFIVSYNLELLLATDGYPERSTIYVTLGVVLNVFLDWYTIFRLDWGIVGAGLATSFSQTVVIAIYLVHFSGSRATLRFKRFRFRKGLLRREFMCGLPSGITEMSPGIVTFIFNNFITAFLHDRELIIYSILSYVILLASVLANGIAQGAQPLVSYYHGRRERASFHTIFGYEIRTGIALSVIEIILVLTFGNHIAALFVGSDSNLNDDVLSALRFIAVAFPVLSLNIIIAGYLTALERSRVAVVISLMRCTVTLVVSIAVISIVFGLSKLWLSLPISEAICLIFAVRIYKKTRSVAASEELNDM